MYGAVLKDKESAAGVLVDGRPLPEVLEECRNPLELTEKLQKLEEKADEHTARLSALDSRIDETKKAANDALLAAVETLSKRLEAQQQEASGTIAKLSSEVKLLQMQLVSCAGSNPFSVTFSDLSEITVARGVWTKSKSALAFGNAAKEV